jgi:hypothetical protein
MSANREMGIIPVSNETHASSSRITREGRKITYRAHVIQQPVRARACGSGAKSCADRRPVDPPPIIELRIFEGNAGEETDITQKFNANFFIFATLENARPIAQPRGSASPISLPVLTGSPVAGIAHLERPKPAGYFIFPDLSVRHEGKYRLSFSLYEELKESKDMDSETPQNSERLKSAHVSHRLEVKTAPFTVYSAKKFPGLATSTQLSQIFAEQGCRVRIRRDVRMRRRADNKLGRGDDFEYDEEPDFNRPRVSATPEQYAGQSAPVAPPHPHPGSVEGADRQRSASIVSSGHIHVRRPSAEQLPQTYPQAPYAASPQTPQGMYPPQQWSQTPPVQQQPYMPPPPQYQYSQPQYPTAPVLQMPPPPHGYAPYQQPEQHHSRHNSIEYPQAPVQAPPRSTSTPQPQSQQPPVSPYTGYSQQPYGAPNVQHHQQPSSNSQYHQSSSHVSPVQPVPHSAPIPAHQPMHSYAPPPQKTEPPPQQAPPQSQSAQPSYYNQPPAVAGSKRSYESSFDTQSLNQPLRRGARPTTTSMDPKYTYTVEPATPPTAADDDMPFDLGSMSYRRADGSRRDRRIPQAS